MPCSSHTGCCSESAVFCMCMHKTSACIPICARTRALVQTHACTHVYACTHRCALCTIPAAGLLRTGWAMHAVLHLLEVRAGTARIAAWQGPHNAKHCPQGQWLESRVGQNRINTPCILRMIVQSRRIYNPHIYLCWPTLLASKAVYTAAHSTRITRCFGLGGGPSPREVPDRGQTAPRVSVKKMQTEEKRSVYAAGNTTSRITALQAELSYWQLRCSLSPCLLPYVKAYA